MTVTTVQQNDREWEVTWEKNYTYPDPETPDTPETPDEPDEPDTPDTPEEPETPDTPSRLWRMSLRRMYQKRTFPRRRRTSLWWKFLMRMCLWRMSPRPAMIPGCGISCWLSPSLGWRPWAGWRSGTGERGLLTDDRAWGWEMEPAPRPFLEEVRLCVLTHGVFSSSCFS